MLVVTFTRAASQELRERVRAPARRGRAGARPTRRRREPDNQLHAWLLDGDDAELARRLPAADRGAGRPSTPPPSRPSTSSASSCCAASASPVTPTPGATLVEDLEQLTSEVVDDLYLARFGRPRRQPPWTRAEALAIARAVVGDPRARVEPVAVLDRGARLARGRAGPLRDRRPRRGRAPQAAARACSATTTCSASSPTPSTDADAPARARMRQRWKVVLIDEFQDTDPVQWQVFERAFAGSPRWC